jgi:U3 small nucleolar RNA-associated protein MPP10
VCDARTQGLFFSSDRRAHRCHPRLQPKAHIQSISNTASISLESALPPTLRASTLLAPEEVFNPPSAADLVASSELTPGEKRARHGKDKKRRRKHRDQLEAMEGMSGQSGRKRVGTRQAKDEALKTLVKEGKGVRSPPSSHPLSPVSSAMQAS